MRPIVCWTDNHIGANCNGFTTSSRSKRKAGTVLAALAFRFEDRRLVVATTSVFTATTAVRSATSPVRSAAAAMSSIATGISTASVGSTNPAMNCRSVRCSATAMYLSAMGSAASKGCAAGTATIGTAPSESCAAGTAARTTMRNVVSATRSDETMTAPSVVISPVVPRTDP